MCHVLEQTMHRMSLSVLLMNSRAWLAWTAEGGCPQTFPLLFHKRGG